MRSNSLAHAFLSGRGLQPQPFPADEWRQRGLPSARGEDVAATYGLLAHYTTQDGLAGIVGDEMIRGACWLTPAPLAACMAPYDLGLSSPRDICLLVDVSEIPELWGPGATGPSSRHPGVWQGGGIEFYCPTNIGIDQVREVIAIAPCGDIRQ